MYGAVNSKGAVVLMQPNLHEICEMKNSSRRNKVLMIFDDN